MNHRSRRRFIVIALAILALSAFPAVSSANHAWGNYHWARTSNPFTLKLGDNVSSLWDSALSGASTDWSKSTVLDTTVVAGSANPKNCRPTGGRVEVCNSTYGNNGWLGVAQIWASGSHITQGTVKLNDTYFNTPTYNTSAWRNLVTCQEIGHTFGLDHQDENFSNANLNTCMDYTNDPSTNQPPNQHDYDELQIIYSHLDSTTTVGAALPGAGAGATPPDFSNGDFNTAAEWGQLVRSSADGRVAVYARDFGGGHTLITFVTWAE
jgi:hypothetical protein